MPDNNTIKLPLGSLVRFRVGDILNMDPLQFFDRADPQLIIEGKIIDFSDGGGLPKQYAVVAVEGLAHYLLVSIGQLEEL